jgi:cytochrome c biogenesis protein CcmG/thiol:disulfide interchange protein DsbE
MAKSKFTPLMALPPIIFAIFAGLAYVALRSDNLGELPSALLSQPAPGLERLEALRDDPAPADADLRVPGAKIVNFWASWCGPCRAEHPVLAEISEAGMTVIGINYKDEPKNALKFLSELGDPYAMVGADESGRTGIDWGIYGVPETFVISSDGTILLRHPGPLTREIVEKRLRPALEAAAE